MSREPVDRSEAPGWQLRRWGCLATLGFSVVLAELADSGSEPDVTVAPTSHVEDLADEHRRSDDFVPTLTDTILEQQREALGADFAFELGGTPELRAFAMQEHEHDWFVAFYERRSSRWTRLAPLFGPTGYDAPHLEGDPPMLAMRMRAPGIPFRFRREGATMIFEAQRGP